MYIIRTDGNAKIGAGHLMRCITIAEAILEKEQVIFLCADSESAAFAKQKGFYALVLETDYHKMEAELPFLRKTFDYLLENNSQWMETPVILVDSYFVTEYYLQALSQYGTVVLLDDMAKQAFPVNTVINYNAYATKAQYTKLYKEANTECYIGSDYIPLRSQFLRKNYKPSNQVSDILITTGGGDSSNIASQILHRIYDENIKFHIISGKFNPNFKALKQLESSKKNIFIHYDVTDMASTMEACDLAITAGGTTIYELAVMGVPFICFSYAENQEKLCEYIGKHDMGKFGGYFHIEPRKTLENIQNFCTELKNDFNIRNYYSQRATKMVDGFGADRIAQILKEKKNGKAWHRYDNKDNEK